MAKRFTTISLFSGGMGLDIGFERTGRFQLLACIEKIPVFCETIRLNRDQGRIAQPSLKVYEEDISNVSPDSLLRDLGLEKGSLDVLIGGPPCQAFSVYGKRRGASDSRGNLVFQFCRFVAALQPHTFVMENVRGLHSMPKVGSKRKGSLLEQILEEFEANGYRSDCFLVNSANYGAPQIRERMIVIGNRHNLEAAFPQPTHSDRPTDGLPPFSVLGDAIRGIRGHDSTIMDFSERKKKYLSKVPPGGNWRSLPIEIQKESMGKTFYLKGGRSAYWRKLSYEFPSPTIVTMPNHAGTSLCHPEELRPLSVGECARVQGFPCDWIFAGTPSEKYLQVGNAVPIVLGAKAGETVATLLDAIRKGSKKQTILPIASRVVHLRPHVRTRWWWKDGEVVNGLPYHQRPKSRAKKLSGPTLFD